MRRRPGARLTVLAAAFVLAACTTSPATPQASPTAEQPSEPATETEPAEPLQPVLTDVAEAPRVLPATTTAESALAISTALFAEAPVVVVAADGDLAAQTTAASTAVALGVPLLVTATDPAPLTAELERLGTEAVVTVGTTAHDAAVALDGPDVVQAPVDPAGLGDLVGAAWTTPAPAPEPQVTTAAAALDPAAPALIGLADAPAPAHVDPSTLDLPATEPATPSTTTTVLTTGASTDLPAVATARAAGAQVLVVPGGDPRTAEAVTALGASKPQRTLALGAAFGDDARLGARAAAASTGVQLPGGGQVVFPGRRMVAIYGTPGTPSLGVLGEQPLDAAIARAAAVAAEYAPISDVPVVPTLEIIATVASGGPGPDGDYSNEIDPESLRPWVEAAAAAGQYVLLDLQPGTTDFLTQARRYESLLAYPNVGLALDPEWRLAPGERHLEQIGSVGIDEVNAVGDWLAQLTRDRALPQKVLVLHQFTPSMIVDRGRLDLGHDELAVVIHADGNGGPGAKIASWDRLRADAPAVSWGWKNFYDEDSPTFTPQQTYDLQPRPVLVTYQ